MNRPSRWLVAPALLASAALMTTTAGAAEIRDKAKLFSAEAVERAQAELDRAEKEFGVPTTIETIDSLDGDTIAQVLNRRAQAVGGEGVYVLIPKKEHSILAESSKHYRQYLTRDRMKSVEAAFTGQFKEGKFDDGLKQGVSRLGTVYADAKADAGGTIRQNTAPNARRRAAAAPAPGAPAGKPSGGFGMSLIAIVLGILAILFVFRILGALFGAGRNAGAGYGGGPMMGNRGYGPGGPGYGGPGYGGGYGGAPAGGGGFMSSLFGGIGGAMAGNWLYDRMSGGHHNTGYSDPNAGYDPNAGAAPVDTSPEWSGNDAGTDWGGGTAVDNSGGGDWGGGGGDWGGGDAGGGDWGGGGGGDDNGGTW